VKCRKKIQPPLGERGSVKEKDRKRISLKVRKDVLKLELVEGGGGKERGIYRQFF